MDTKIEIREFLTSRRARITPEQAGLPVLAGNRRVPGLRREEVATLAGVSVDYYNRMERGNLSGVSESVLDALSRALQLDEAERAHLSDLARAAHPSAKARPGRSPKQRIRPSIQWALDGMTGAAAVVSTRHLDFLAANPLGYALFSEMDLRPGQSVNSVRFVFLDPRARDFYVDWGKAASDCVAALRSEAGRDPHDRKLSDLVGELSTQSEEFRSRWASHNVRFHRTGTKQFHHPIVGDLQLSFDGMQLGADEGLMVFTYAAEPGSKSEEALNLLASWAATPHDAEPARLRQKP